VIFAAAVIMAQIERRSVGVYGLRLEALSEIVLAGLPRRIGRSFSLVGLIAAFGGIPLVMLRCMAKSCCVGEYCGLSSLFVGLFEEFLFRGYTQYTLADGIGFWPAAVVLSCRLGPSIWGIPAKLGRGGRRCSDRTDFRVALRRTGNLWLCVGWHASFDFGETFLYSVPNSGIVSKDTCRMHPCTAPNG